MARPVVSLWWSGLAAGLSISFSLLAQAILQLHIAETAWRPLVTSFGYTVGFVMVVLSRQQLFTENTITVILPVMAQWSTTRSQACDPDVGGGLVRQSCRDALFGGVLQLFSRIVSRTSDGNARDKSAHPRPVLA